MGEREVREALLARLADDDRSVRREAVEALAAAVGEAEVRDGAARPARPIAISRSAAAKVLGAGIVAEKFGLPAGEIEVVYP